MCALLICMTLVSLGLVMVYSSSSVLANVRFGDSGLFLKKQAIRVLIGSVLMFAFSRLPLHWWARFSRPIMLLALVSLLLVLAWGHGAAQRWLSIPALGGAWPFSRPSLPSWRWCSTWRMSLVRKREELHDFSRGFIPRLLVVGFALMLIVLQPDLGTAIALGLIALIMLWIGGMRLYHLAGAGLLALLGIGLSLRHSSYQMRRLVNLLTQNAIRLVPTNSYSRSAAWAMAAFWGGLGNSMQKEQYLPEPHTDFVFSVIGEEMGLVGTLIVLGLFAAFSFYGLRIGARAGDAYGFLVAIGITAMISIYALLNIGVVVGVLPTTGLPLPFVSYGGSSLMGNMAGVGILLGIARTAPKHQEGLVRWQR